MQKLKIRYEGKISKHPVPGPTDDPHKPKIMPMTETTATPPKDHTEHHRIHRSGGLRAAVLGANDGIVSTASLIVGVAAANSSPQNILLTGVAGLVAGAMSMAAGEYVSVSSQTDTEKADLKREKKELATNLEAEQSELAQI